MLAPSVLETLARIVGPEGVIVDPDRLLVYESDGLVQHRGRPVCVVLPRSTDEAAAVVRALAPTGLALVPRGAGTGLSGGAVPGPGAVVIGTARMNRVLEFDPTGRRARLQSGVVNAELSQLAAPHGLHYAPDPSSQTACTIGGNVAENSGGPHCLKYGVTSRYVTALTLVDAAGDIVRLSRDGALPMPDLVGAFIGSEGCFGLVTEVEVRLSPIALGVRTLLAPFPSLEAAGTAVSALIATGVLPAALEIMDQPIVQAVEDSIFAAGYPREAGAVLVAEFDGPPAVLDEQAELARSIFRDHGAGTIREADDEGQRAALWKGRKKAFGALGRLAPDLLVQDATVPRSRLPEVLRGIEEVARRHAIPIANVFHAGDGNLHPNLLFDRRRDDELCRVEAASREIMELCVRSGGTITGEHGVGLDKRGYMHLVHGPAELEAQRRVRRVFDPQERWNPGKVLPDPGPIPQGEATVPAQMAPDLTGSASSPAVALIEHEPADLVVTVDGSVSLAELQSVLARQGQWLAIDALPMDSEAMASESRDWNVADLVLHAPVNALGASHGAVRDLVLGVTLAPDGTSMLADTTTPDDTRAPDPTRAPGDTLTPVASVPLRLGGRVVKNVAGFDLCRLVVGSRGLFGTVERVTFRLHPLAERDVVLRATGHGPGDARTLASLADRWAGVAPAPAAVEFIRTPDGSTEVRARVLGSPALVDCTLEALRAAAAEALPDGDGPQEPALSATSVGGVSTSTGAPIPTPGTPVPGSGSPIPNSGTLIPTTGTLRGGWFGRTTKALDAAQADAFLHVWADQGLARADRWREPDPEMDPRIERWVEGLRAAFVPSAHRTDVAPPGSTATNDQPTEAT
jgi:glycolate oxidase subunit GlcD